jgi:hypothetical protein
LIAEAESKQLFLEELGEKCEENRLDLKVNENIKRLFE